MDRMKTGTGQQTRTTMTDRYVVERTTASNSGFRYFIRDLETSEPVRDDDETSYIVRFKSTEHAQFAADQLNAKHRGSV